MSQNRITITPGPAGWVEAEVRDTTLYARFTRDGKSWKMAELRLYEPASDVLRTIPLARVQSAANATLTAVGLSILKNQPEPSDIRKWFAKEKRRAQAHRDAGRFILERPDSRKLDDPFYARVAEAYRQAVALGLNPRQTLAHDSDAAPDTVARWIGESRRRGFLAAGRPGRVTT